MVESTDYLLHKHFGKFLEDKNVEILDPATGTGDVHLRYYRPHTHRQAGIQIQERTPRQRGGNSAVLHCQSEYRVHVQTKDGTVCRFPDPLLCGYAG